MKTLTAAAIVVGLCYSAASAQTTTPNSDTKPAGQETSRAECLANFKKADANGDGTISVAEAESAPEIVPTSLGLSGPISQEQYLASCENKLPKGG
jgi:cytochrome oxidase Cu insertion factor (SCO1/SenC/PrrC family)